MDKGLTPYLLVIGPVLMFIAFMTGPEDVLGQEYIDYLKDTDLNTMIIGTILVTVGAIMMFGGWFVLTQDMMAKSNKTQRDLLMLSRVALILPITLLLLATGMDMEAHWLVTEGEDGLTVEEEEAIALQNREVSTYFWGTMPITWALGLILIGVAALMGDQKDKHSEQWVFAGPLVTGLGLISAYWIEEAWLFFMVAIIISLPIGIMMLMGKLDYLYSESD
jgi:hypothetical protein